MPVLGLPDYSAPTRLGLNMGQPDGMTIQKAVDYGVTQDRSLPVVVGGVGGLGALDLVDTVASSIPGLSGALGVKRGDVNRAALQAIDLPGLGDFYHDYKGGIEATSGVLGAVAAGVITEKLTGPASGFMGMLRELPYARRIAALDEQYANALQVVRAADTQLAARGALGAEQYVGRTTVDTQLWNHETGTFLPGVVEGERKGFVRTARALGALNTAKQAALTEGFMALTMNQNGFLYDDSAATNMVWQGIGLAGAGVTGWLHSAYQMRKFVNADEIRRVFANALDPGADEESRLLWHGKKVEPDEAVSFLGGSFSDRATNLSVNARTLTERTSDGTAAAAALEESSSRLATQWMSQAREETQKLTRRGISSDTLRTKFALTVPGYGNHMDMLIHRDPAVLYGAEQVGAIPDDMTAAGIHESHTKRLQERIDETEEEMGSMLDEEGNLKEDASPKRFALLQGLGKRLDFETTLTPMVSIDAELMPLSEAEPFQNFKEPLFSFTPEERVAGSVKGTVAGDRHGLWEIKSENPRGNISLDTGFVYHIPGSKSLDKTDLNDMMNLYRLGNKSIEQMRQFKGPLTLPKKPDWFQLDMAEELLRRTEGRANVVFPEGMSREDARIESLVQKSQAVKLWDKSESAKALKAESTGNTYEGQLSKLRLRYNIPRLSAYERGILGNDAEHPTESLLRGLASMEPDEIRKMNLNDVREAMGRFKRLGDIAPVQSSDLEDMGTSFKFMLDEKGNPIKPILIYKRPFQVATWTKEYNAERLAARMMNSVVHLTNEDAGPLTRTMAQSMLGSPDLQAASRTHELMDTQVQGGIAGAAPQQMGGAIGKAFISSDWRDRDNPILLAASRLREGIIRQARDGMKQVINGAFEGQLGLLSNPRNASSKLLLNQFHTFRPGWDIGTDALKRADGFHAFVLRPTEDNAERFRTMFGREMAKNQLLLAPNGKEVVLDDLGMDMQKRFNQVTDAVVNEKNTVLRANGFKEITPLEWYTPPPNTRNKLIGFTFGPDDKPIPNMTVVADTPQEFARARDDIYKKISELGIGYRFRTQDSVREYASIWDKVQMDFLNPGMTAIQPGKHSRGALTGLNIRTDAFEDSLKYLQDSFLEHANDVTQTLLSAPIKSAQARGLISGEMTRNLSRRGYSGESRNIHDYYLENLLGKPKIGSSWVGNLYRAIEGPLDKLLGEATPRVASMTSTVWNATNGWLNKAKLWDNSEQSRKDFDALTTQLGKYMPFESATQMAEAQGLGATPGTVKSMAAGLNKFSAAVILRMLEVGQPIMNMAGILNASPAVIRQFSPMRGENAADFAARVGHAATIFDLGDGRQLGTMDIAKITQRAFQRAWSRESEPDWRYMSQRGYLSQEVAEFQRQFGAIDTPGKWHKFFEGDPNADGFNKKGLVGWTSVLSDKSEDFSRSWAHMVGLEVADNLGITQMEAKHAFAHDVANKMIANYSPTNRPEIFQGAIGSLAGLFQSFVLNYYERMVRYTELKDYKALATQLATQTGLFGLSSIPGWQQFNSFVTKGDGSDDPTSSIWRRFGGNAGDLIGHGLISQIPKLFGAPGADLYSRGDVSIRQIQIQDPSSIVGVLNSTVPAFNVVKKVYDGLTGGVKMFWDNRGHLSASQVAEVLSNTIANRPLAGILEQFAHGADTDSHGALVARSGQGSIVDNVLAKDWAGSMEAAYRMLGLRSERQSNELQAFYANRNAMTHQAALMEELTQYTRGALRDKNFDSIPHIFETYVKNGGDPRNFRRWLKGTYISATSTRGQIMLSKVAHDPQKMDQVLRLLDAGVTPDQDQAIGDEPNKRYVASDQGDPPDVQDVSRDGIER